MSLRADTAAAVGPRRGCDVQQVPIPGAGRSRVTGQDTVTCAAALLAPSAVRNPTAPVLGVPARLLRNRAAALGS